jgi:hypothetical protein
MRSAGARAHAGYLLLQLMVFEHQRSEARIHYYYDRIYQPWLSNVG